MDNVYVRRATLTSKVHIPSLFLRTTKQNSSNIDEFASTYQMQKFLENTEIQYK